MGYFRKYIGWEFLMAGVLLLLPFFSYPQFSPEDQFSLPKLFGLCFIGALCISILLSRAVHWSLGVLNFIIMLNVVYTGFGSAQIYALIYWMACLAGGVYFTRSDKLTDLFFKAVMWSGVGAASYAYIQMLDMDFILSYAPGIDSTLPISFFGQQTKYGSFVCLALVIALARKEWFLALFMFFTAWATESSFTMASVFIGGFIAIRPYLSRRAIVEWIIGVLAVLALAYWSYPNANAFYPHGRYVVWGSAIKYTNEHNPIMGSGVGSFAALYPPQMERQQDGSETPVPGTGIQPASIYQHGYFNRAHGEFVEAYFCLGLIGIFGLGLVLFYAVGAYVIAWFMVGLESIVFLSAAAVFAAGCVNAFGNFIFQMAPQNLIIMVSLCVLLRLKHALN